MVIFQEVAASFRRPNCRSRLLRWLVVAVVVVVATFGNVEREDC